MKQMKSENKNFIYNVCYQVLISLFPLITIPYISRILGVDNIGIYSYTYSIVNIFMLISMLGINNYGNRAISKVREDKQALSKTFFSIYFLQIILSVIMAIIYILFVTMLELDYKIIFYLQIFHLLGVAFDVNWFFFGLEKFKLTLVRNFLIRVISFILILFFVKSIDDLWKYTLIMSMSIFLSQIFLLTKIRQYINYVKVTLKDIQSNLKGCFILFIPVLAYAVYRIMDKTMLGYFSVTELGFYENAERIISLPLSIIMALGTVMLPRMSYMLHKDKSNVKGKIYESMKLLLLLSVTMSLGIILVSNDAALIIFGEEFQKSGMIMILLSATIVIGAWANIVRTQYLIPIGKDKIYIISTICGAVVNLISNIIFIPRFGAYGACIGTILAEFVVMMYQIIATRKELEYKKYFKLFIEYLVKSGAIMLITYLLTNFIDNTLLRMLLQITIATILFIIIYRDYLLYEFLNLKTKGKVNLDDNTNKKN